MKTSKEMQLKILDRMKENVKRDLPLFDGLYRVIYDSKFILDGLWDNSFKGVEHGIYPETITINGVDIPKPLEKDDLLEISIKEKVYSVSSNYFLYMELYSYIAEDQGYKLVYRTKEEAIEASKLLFEIKQ